MNISGKSWRIYSGNTSNIMRKSLAADSTSLMTVLAFASHGRHWKRMILLGLFWQPEKRYSIAIWSMFGNCFLMQFLQLESCDLSTTVPKRDRAINYRVILTYRGPVQMVRDKEINKGTPSRGDSPDEGSSSASSLDEKGAFDIWSYNPFPLSRGFDLGEGTA